MLRSAAISIIQRGLGFRTDLSDEIVSALQQAQRLLEQGRSLPDFLKEEDATLTVTSGTADIAFPTGFIREVDGETFRRTDTNTERIVKLEKFIDLTLLRQTLETPETDPGAPIAYYVRKASFAFFPERDASYDLTYSYYKKATELTSDIENAWLASAPDVLIGRAGMLIAEDLGSDPGMKARYLKFKDMHDVAWRGMFSETILRSEANYPMNMGGRL